MNRRQIIAALVLTCLLLAGGLTLVMLEKEPERERSTAVGVKLRGMTSPPATRLTAPYVSPAFADDVRGDSAERGRKQTPFDQTPAPARTSTGRTTGARTSSDFREAAGNNAVTSAAPADDVGPRVGTAAIDGWVIGHDRERVGAATVIATHVASGGSRRTQSGADGRFELDGLRPGAWLLAAEKNGARGGVGPIPAVAGTAAVVHIFLGADASVGGEVVDAETGEPIPGVHVLARDVAHRLEASAFTGADGRYRMAVPAPAEFLMFTRHPDYVDSPPRWNIAVAKGENKAGPDFAVQRGVTLRGVVLGPEDAPVSDAAVLLVDLLNDQGGDKGETVSDSEGRFVFTGRKPGAKYVARAVHPEQGFGESRPVLALPGHAQPELRVWLQPGQTARGRLLTDSGQGVPALDVWLLRAGGQLWRPIPGTRTQSGADGRFGINNVPPGDYQFVVVTAHTTRLAGAEFTVREGEAPGEVVVRLGDGPHGVVEGRILSPEGEPLPEVEVIAGTRDPLFLAGATNTDGDGRYRVEGLGPAVQVHVEARGFRLGRVRKSLSDVPVSSSGVDFVLGRMGSLAGRVVDADTAEPVTSFRVRGPLVDRSFDSPDGSFLVDELQVTSGAFLFTAPGYLPAVHDPGEMAPGQVVDGVTVAMRTGAWIEGTVRTVAGAPVNGARVKYLPDGQVNPGSVGSEHFWSASDPFTDAQGRFFLQARPEGELNSFVVWHPDYDPVVLTNTLERSFEITLNPAP